jgi:hypothetical protein
MPKRPLSLAKVTGIVITEEPTAFRVSWGAVEGANKYVLKVEATYDMGTPGDLTDDEYREIDVESTPDLTVSVPKVDLTYEADETSGAGAAPMKITADVKPMAIGRAGKKRHGTWSKTPAVWPAA